MDKLEPVLKHHFWILLVPLLSMNLWGYFSANSALKDATKSREDKLTSVKSGIPAGADAPNEKYAAELTKLNDALEKDVNEELKQLWSRQQARMTWPQVVADKIPTKHRDDIKDQLVRFTYQNIYQLEVIKPLYESVEPVVPNPKDLAYVPKVDFPYALIPQMRLGGTGSITTISSKQMWDAQEDVWVTQLILDAIRQMNKDADSASSAVIRRVIAFRLLGGDGTPAAGAGAAEGDPLAAMGDSGMTAPGMGRGGAGAAGSIQTSVKFNPAEEFGVGGEAQANTGMGGLPAMSSGMIEPDAGAAEGAEGTEILRYVGKENADAKFDERGFYLSVIINQNKLVDFLVSLSNSEWPVRVVRFQFGRNPWKTDEFRSMGGGQGNPLAMMGAGSAGSLGSLGALGAPGSGDPASASGYAPPGSGDPASGLGGLPGGDIASGMGMGLGGNTGYKITDLDHPDLIQLDLCGLVTIYRQPAIEEAPTEGGEQNTTPSEGTDPPASPPAENPPSAGSAGENQTPPEGTPAPAAPGEATPPEAASPPATPDPAAPMPTEPAPAAEAKPEDGAAPVPAESPPPAEAPKNPE